MLRQFFGNIIHSVLEDNVSDVNPIEHDSLIKKYEEYKKNLGLVLF
jgi:hypothetical protein